MSCLGHRVTGAGAVALAVCRAEVLLWPYRKVTSSPKELGLEQKLLFPFFLEFLLGHRGIPWSCGAARSVCWNK